MNSFCHNIGWIKNKLQVGFSIVPVTAVVLNILYLETNIYIYTYIYIYIYIIMQIQVIHSRFYLITSNVSHKLNNVQLSET